ncbi:MAG: 3-phosphoserine/phosphohydroxythreonine transaminase [Spirochaetales bacterium]|jgi:phosphoserine aminotransferase|nr:3-phosphoserine/phosphohydroxythreonine transaminase [Spirochaetales bacterium]
MRKVFNFSSGPSMLPETVLSQAAGEMLDYEGSGQSVMEMSHRSAVFEKIRDEAEELLFAVMNIPKNYKVLFLQGGASLQFSMVPLNLLPEGGVCDYIESGIWAAKAADEAEKYGCVARPASSRDSSYSRIPPLPPPSKGASYYHITTNNTICGTRYTQLPPTGPTPLVADMSSNILSEPVEVNKFGLIYAGAQKNLGPAGTTLVIIREDLIGKHRPETPLILRYDLHAQHKSTFNTPPCYGIYIIKKVLEDLIQKGGVKAAHSRNTEKAALLYDFLDRSQLFAGTAEKPHRSLMNVTYTLPTQELTRAFLAQAEAQGLVNLGGHKLVGGIRASIYNAMPIEGVQKLVSLMEDFEAHNIKHTPKAAQEN